MARHRSSGSRGLKLLLLASAVLAAVYGVVVTRDWRAIAERRLGDLLGRPVSIGAVDLAREWPPRITVEELSITGWGQGSVSSAGEVSLTISPGQFFKSGELGRLVVYGLRLSGGEDELAWAQSLQPRLKLAEHLRVNLQDARYGEDLLIVDQAEFGVAHNGFRPFTAEFSLYGEPFVAEGKLGLAEDPAKPALLQLAIGGGAAELEFDGSVRPSPFGFAGALAFRVRDGDALSAWIGVPASVLEGLRLSGMVEKNRQKVELARIEATWPNLKVTGKAGFSVPEGEEMPRLTLKIATGALSLPLPALEDALPLPPELPFEFEAEIAAESLQLGAVALSRLDAVVRGGAGEVAVERLVADGLGGTIEAAGAIRTESEGPRMDVLVDLRQSDAEAVLTAFGLDADSLSGRLGAHLELSLAAHDWQTAIGEAKGRLGLYVDRGALNRPMLAALSGTPQDQVPAETELSCAVGDFALSEGTAHAEFMRLMGPEGEITGLGWARIISQEISFLVGNVGEAEPPLHIEGQLRLQGSLQSPEIFRIPSDALAPLPSAETLAEMMAAFLPQLRAALGEDSPCLAPPAEKPTTGGQEEPE